MSPHTPAADLRVRAAWRSDATCKGFSMMEMVIVIVLIGIIFSIGGLVLGRMFEAYFTTREVSDAQWQGVVALERMSRELRFARSATDADLSLSPADRITFTDIEGNVIEYYLTGSALTRSAAGTAQTLADNISDLGFFYLRDNGQTDATSAATVSYITVRVRVISDGETGYTETLRATVQPRNY